jgi:predicted nucleotidyltransferase
MDKREAEVRAKQYIKEARRVITFDKAVLFGSYAHGRPEEYSDIDIGLFVDRLDANIDYLSLVSQLYHAARKIDVRIEPHLFIREEDESGFAEEIERIGVDLST